MTGLPRTTQPQKSRPAARWGTLGLALGAGLAAALLAFLLVRGRTASGSSAPELVSVVVAAETIPARTRLTEGLLEIRRVPLSDAPEGFVGNRADVVGKVTLHPVAPGKAIVSQSVAAADAALGLAFSLPPSSRAVTVALDPADGVEAFARPGDHVDILATDEPGSAPAETRTVLQNVTLLAVGAQTSPEDAAPVSAAGVSRVTVAVSPAQAQALVLAAARGRLHLALRPADDSGIASLPAFPAPPPMRAVIPAPAPRPPAKPAPVAQAKSVAAPTEPLLPLPLIAPPPRPARVTITVIKGSQSQTVTVAP